MSINGTWDITMKTPIGNQEIRLVAQSDGKTVTGTQSSGSESVEIQDGLIEGDQVTWTAQTTKPMPMQVKFTAQVDGDDMSGKAKAGLFPAASFAGRRAEG